MPIPTMTGNWTSAGRRSGGRAKDAPWQTDLLGIMAGKDIHSALDEYNNYGSIDDTPWTAGAIS
jgi:hypothetical protein